MQELFETRNGRVIMDEDLSSKMYLIKQYHPEKADETSSGFEWSEMGMANLFGLLYSAGVALKEFGRCIKEAFRGTVEEVDDVCDSEH